MIKKPGFKGEFDPRKDFGPEKGFGPMKEYDATDGSGSMMGFRARKEVEAVGGLTW